VHENRRVRAAQKARDGALADRIAVAVGASSAAQILPVLLPLTWE
jgi:hypothetical protein